MKKIVTIGAIALAGLTLAACGNNASSNSNSNTNSSAKSSESVNKFGQSVLLTKNNQKARMVIQNVQVVDPDDTLVTDVSHNYKDTHQYVIVTYKVTAVSSKVDLDAFDGSNLSLYDSKGQSSVPSSNRDSVAPDELHKGETQVMKMGFGLRAKSSKVTINYGNETWKGKVTNNSVTSKDTSSSNAVSTADTPTNSQQSATQTSNSNQATQVSNSPNNSEVTIGGHKFHHENFYGNDILVGNNNEGEAGEWAANDPSVRNDPNVKAQLNSIYGN